VRALTVEGVVSNLAPDLVVAVLGSKHLTAKATL
jgi:hypothetical protein